VWNWDAEFYFGGEAQPTQDSIRVLVFEEDVISADDVVGESQLIPIS
jgi:hypothetical protein